MGEEGDVEERDVGLVPPFQLHEGDDPGVEAIDVHSRVLVR